MQPFFDTIQWSAVMFPLPNLISHVDYKEKYFEIQSSV